MNTNEKLEFPATLRRLRTERHLTQREAGEAVGLAESSYGNAESSNHRKLSLARVHRIAQFYGLDRAATDQLVAAYNALPESPWHQANKPRWDRRNLQRAKAKQLDSCKLSLLCMITLLITNVADPGALCTCASAEVDMFAEDSSSQPECDLCDALRLLGLTGWTNLDDVIAKLATAQERMTG